MPTAHLVHGFNVSDGGASTLDKLRSSFEDRGFSVLEHDSRWSRGIFRDLLSVRFGNGNRAERLASAIRPDDVIVGHSNGCAVITMACWLLAQMEPTFKVRCMFLNPALDRDASQSPIVSGVLVFHTKSDWIVRAASWLPFHKWGSMGRLGHNGIQKAVYWNVAYETLGLRKLGHSGVFKHKESLQLVMQGFDDWTEELEL